MMMTCIYLFKFRLGYSADAVSSEVGVPGLDAPEATKVFVSLLLPLGDEVRVRYPLLAAVVVQLYTHTHTINNYNLQLIASQRSRLSISAEAVYPCVWMVVYYQLTYCIAGYSLLTPADGLASVVEIVNVPGPLVVDLEYRPQRLNLTLTLVRLRLRYTLPKNTNCVR
jgi:hypothetical protein